MIRIIIVTLVALLFATPANAETSLEYAKLSQKIFAAFQCSIAARDANKHDARKRLFTLGLESGKVFLEALQQGKIDKKDVGNTVAMGVLASLAGPSNDFIMGRLWESAIKNYYDKSTENCERCSFDEELKVMKGNSYYRDKNCEFLK